MMVIVPEPVAATNPVEELIVAEPEPAPKV